MYGGKVLERADRRTLFFSSHHPYTEGLLQSLPGYGGERARLRPIPGTPPSLLDPPAGCPFAPRCPYVMDRCTVEMPGLDAVVDKPGHLSACWLPRDSAARQDLRRKILDAASVGTASTSTGGA
jgi:oligopeptide/dipeptide ABC transporter ATP-binding protein